MVQMPDRGGALRVAIEGRSYSNLVFLATRFPLGLLYSVVFFTMAAVGFGLLSVLVGVPLLALTLAVAWGFASFERDLVRWWLGLEMPPMSLPRPPGLTLWRRLRRHLGNAVTWKSLAYVLLQLPVGLIVFVLLVALLGAALALSVAPAVYLADALTFGGTGGRFEGLLLSISGGETGVQGRGLVTTLALAAAGLGLFVLTLHAANALAGIWGSAARQMLSVGESELQLNAARLQALAEHTRAEQSEERRRELITNVSHELRTPLASIQAHVESLNPPEGGRPGPVETERYLNVIARETERLSSLVDDLVVVAGADSGGLRLTMARVSVSEVVDHVHSALAPLARRERSVSLVRNLPPQPLPPVIADRDRLIQVLMNLVRNAFAYTEEGGIVSLESAVVPPGWVVITVSDTGVGIPPEELERVFERFYRSDPSRARSTGGFGLGLSIARDLIEAMGGRITAESEVGGGSRFAVWLPADPAARGDQPWP
jgi:two-component system, OmpR family, phosphate regulon sensor histidine kinase PhoR